VDDWRCVRQRGRSRIVEVAGEASLYLRSKAHRRRKT
jgi:hypothetical protein